jgi:hypothetical protein
MAPQQSYIERFKDEKYRTTYLYLCENYTELYFKIQFVPHSKHSVSAIKKIVLILYKVITVDCSEIHNKHKCTSCVQKLKISYC